MNWILLLLVFLAGTATSIQAGVNGTLGKKVGVIEAAFISFLVGTVFLSILLFFMRKGNLMSALETPKWQLTGGLLGATYILIMVIAVPRIGIAAALITLVAGQLISSTFLDHFGLIGDKQIPIDWRRLSAIVLLGISLYLFNKK